jgi:hypothetical protein
LARDGENLFVDITELVSVAFNKVIKSNPVSDGVKQTSENLQERCDAVKKNSTSVTGFR